MQSILWASICIALSATWKGWVEFRRCPSLEKFLRTPMDALIFWGVMKGGAVWFNFSQSLSKMLNAKVVSFLNIYTKRNVTSRNPLSERITNLVARRLIWHVPRSVTTVSGFPSCAIIIFWWTGPSTNSFKPYVGLPGPSPAGGGSGARPH